MSIQIDVRSRLYKDKEDKFIYVKNIYDEYVELMLAFGTWIKNRKCKMDGNVIVRRKNGQEGMYTSEGEIVIPEGEHECEPRFYDNGKISHEVVFVRKDGLSAVYSYDGKFQIVPGIYDNVYLYATHIVIYKDGYIGAYSYEGEQIIPTELIQKKEIIQNDISAFICFNKRARYGVYSETGKLVIPFEYQKITYKYPFFKAVKFNGNSELYSFSGEKILFDHEV